MQSRTSDYSTTLTALIAPTITDSQPSLAVNVADWNIPSNIQLADPAFFNPQRVDLLIGVSIFYDLLCVGQIKLIDGLPLLQKTRLGWIVSGGGQRVSSSSLLATQNSPDLSNDRMNARLDRTLRMFWEVENCAEASLSTKEEADCEAHFVSHFSRLLSGEYSVRLPLKHDADHLGESYTQAYRRFLSSKRKLDRNPALKERYSAFMKEYTDLKHMSKVHPDSRSLCKYFLPHHCVIKEDSPVIQPALFNILIRFRTYPVALTGDICKMYRCVKVSPPDNFLQCILWRDSIQSEVLVYTLDTVTYGTRAASFLAVRAMHQLAIDEGNPYPLGSAALQQEFYVDDLISCGNSVAEVMEKMRQTSSLLSCGNFKLRKWCSSNQEVLDGIPEDDVEKFLRFHDGSDITKTLGLAWDPASDQLLFALSALDSNSRPSKRSVLSTIARFYDPLGLINPFIVRCKIFLQQLWREHLDWDESLPTALHSTWIDLRNSLASISRISFPRVVHHSSTIVEVHGFCDASMEAYGACIYVVSRQGESSSNVLCSKSQVAPLKSLSIPKLELSGAHLLAKVMRSLKETGIFPGSLPSYLIQSELWFHGPSFLLGSKDEWPVSAVSKTPTIELRKRVLLIASPHADLTSGCKFANSFFGMQRTFAYMHKFVHRLRHPGLTVSDIQQGTHLLVRHVQLASLWSDIKEIRRNGQVRKSSSISSLSPFIHPSGLLRVGGRLGNSSLPFNAQHPLILPKGHPVTSAMISYYHQRNLHAGPRALLAKIRLEYWPIGGIKAVSKAVSKCVRCFRTRPRMVEHIMGDLPKERLEGSRAFEVTGVDYCGPFFYRSEIRTRPPIKCYISVFICFTSKAIHMELVKDLTTASFLGALKRFTSTRGRPSHIWSENATNFVGAKNELLELKKLFLSDSHMKEVHESCLADTIDWHFIPPRSPHFGGLWEAAVKSAKYHLYRSVGPSILSFDELRTLICQIAAISILEPDLTKLNFNRLDGWQRVTQLQQTFWRRWREEYLTLLQERSKWRTPAKNLCVNDVVLVKDENLPPMRWPLARVVDVVKGKDGSICRYVTPSLLPSTLGLRFADGMVFDDGSSGEKVNWRHAGLY
ncbi:uncharacterized protein LOC121404526 [Drosophila obscura]|uniref:uncharacterized protein LOC121404526 n=1 Tax=Drosophila obscura TaxID=7282 RepID=UPI001BB2BDC8|nr:uncharacterized protein LOC121404526 [Drosophila obscura]